MEGIEFRKEFDPSFSVLDRARCDYFVLREGPGPSVIEGFKVEMKLQKAKWDFARKGIEPV